MSALILEGGTFRPIFSCGVMDALLDNGIDFSYVIGVTNVETGRAEYLDGKKLDKKCDMLKATCAIPFVFPTIEVDGKQYYDGGIVDPIPVRKAEKDGEERFLIVLTRPKEYRKTLSKANVAAARLLKKKYPKLVKPLLTRHEAYNETVAYCEKLEREGKAVILRPSMEMQIESMEKDLKKIDRLYHFGYEETLRNLDKIKEICF